MISDNIQSLRKRAKLSQEELAEIAGTSRQTVSKWESGESVPDVVACDKMAEALGVTLDDLLHYEEKKEKFPLPPKGKYLFGTVTVGSKGQIVLPKKAREKFNIQPGDSLIVLGDKGKGLALLKASEMMDFVHKAMEMASEEGN